MALNSLRAICAFLIIQALIVQKCCESIETKPATFFCADLNPQNSLDLEQIMGMWYGSEILTHHDSEEGVFYYQTCVVLHLADITSQQFNKRTDHSRNNGRENRDNYDDTTYSSYDNNRHSLIPNHNSNNHNRYLRLIWDEMGTNVEYTLRYNSSRPGFWISSGPQKGTMLEFQYTQFSGTVQVMKAVGNHLVLTFCNHTPGSHLFTIVLGRQPNSLTYEDIQSIRNLLKHRGLSTSSIRKVCTSGASSLYYKFIFFLVIPLSFLSHYIKSFY